MKKTKVRIIEIVKQELSNILREAELPKDREGDMDVDIMDLNTDLESMPPLKQLDPDDFSEEDVLGTSEKRFYEDPGDLDETEFKLINRIFIRMSVDEMSPEEREELAGGDKDVLRLMNDILADPRLKGSPGEVSARFPPKKR